MALETSRVIFGEARLYSVPWNATEGAEFPLATVNALADPGEAYDGTNWIGRGYTQDGMGIRMSVDYEGIPADQSLDDLFRVATGRDIGLTTNLIQMTPDNFAVAFGQGEVDTEAPGEGTRGYNEFKITSTIEERYNSWLLDARVPETGEPYRILVPKGQSIGSVEATFGNRSTAAQIPVDIAALPDNTRGDDIEVLLLREYVAALPVTP